MRRITISLILTASLNLWLAQLAISQKRAQAAQPAIPQLKDPGFESFVPAESPLAGWYSDDLSAKDRSGMALLRLTPDNKNKIEGNYSLKIEQLRARPRGRGQAFLSQAVSLPRQGGLRRFELSAQTRGSLSGPVTIDICVWERGYYARSIAHRNVSVTNQWSRVTLQFEVPPNYDEFGFWFYLPRDNEALLWLDDIQLRPTSSRSPTKTWPQNCLKCIVTRTLI